ncbi:MAG: multicopper oxidase domain-containing protein [Gemmatimonadaceae bacterium]
MEHPVKPAPLLSDLVTSEEAASRRQFLGRSAIGLVIGGSALAACRADQPGQQRPAAGDTPRTAGMQNANSRLDSALHAQVRHGPSSGVPGASRRADDVTYQPYDPALPPRSESRRLELNWRAQEVPVRISSSTVVAGWTFEGNIPGPIVHCRVGDTVVFTLTNEGEVPHSMDFHAAQIDPKVAFRSVAKGQSVSFTFRPKWAGGFMYHCGSAPVLMHIGAGMYGALIVSPQAPLPEAKEFVLVQSEFYLGDADANGVRPFDYNKMLSTTPDFFAFNGRPLQYLQAPLRVKVGDRVRFWLVNCGPTHPCAFHVVGEQFDTMYLGAPPTSPIRGVQTWDVAAGGGMCFELVCDIAGEFPFVNHGFGHGQKGAIGILLVE